jgi:hypothetical protein
LEGFEFKTSQYKIVTLISILAGEEKGGRGYNTLGKCGFMRTNPYYMATWDEGECQIGDYMLIIRGVLMQSITRKVAIVLRETRIDKYRQWPIANHSG